MKRLTLTHDVCHYADIVVAYSSAAAPPHFWWRLAGGRREDRGGDAGGSALGICWHQSYRITLADAYRRLGVRVRGGCARVAVADSLSLPWRTRPERAPPDPTGFSTMTDPGACWPQPGRCPVDCSVAERFVRDVRRGVPPNGWSKSYIFFFKTR